MRELLISTATLHADSELYDGQKEFDERDRDMYSPNHGLPYNAPGVLVQAGILSSHVNRLDPMVPTALNMSMFVEGTKI